MLRYALLRLLGAIPTLLLVIVLAFLMVHAAPGGPFDSERVLPPEVEANIAQAYQLDQPLPQQFLSYMSGLLRGDLGPSYRYRDLTVSDLIGRAFPLSLKLGAMAMNCSHGSTITTAEGAWEMTWPDTLEVCRMADRAGMEALLPVGRWRGYGGPSNFNNRTFDFSRRDSVETV